MREAGSGVLSTHCLVEAGYPIGTLTRFILTVDRRPAMYLGTMAQHTRNIQRNCSVSMTVGEPRLNGYTSGERVTVLGDAEIIPSERVEDVETRYFERFPRIENCPKTTAHSFYWINPIRVRYTAMQGEAFWIEASEWFALVGA